MKITIASATRKETKEEFLSDTWLGKALNKLTRSSGHEINIVLALNRNDGLPVFYNEVLETHKDAEAVIFCHDDLAISDLFFFEKLELALQEFDVVGLVGSRTPKNEAHVRWFSRDDSPSGQIGTSLRPTNEVIFSTALQTFGPTPSRSAEMDGVFICVNPSKIGEHRFDEQFLYHHYDVDFTLMADKLGLVVGTWPIYTIHVSNQGDGYNSRSFRESAEIFTKKWEALKITEGSTMKKAA